MMENNKIYLIMKNKNNLKILDLINNNNNNNNKLKAK